MRILILFLVTLLNFSGLASRAQSHSASIYINLSDIQSVKVVHPAAEEDLQVADTLTFKEPEVLSLQAVQIEKVDSRISGPEEYAKILNFRDRFYNPGIPQVAGILPDAIKDAGEMAGAADSTPFIVYYVYPW